MNTLDCSRRSGYFHCSSSRPARYGTKRFLGGTALLLFLLIPGSSAFAQTTAGARGRPLTLTGNAANSLPPVSLAGTLSSPVTTSPASLAFDGLISIAVTPANPSIVVGHTQQFTATGRFKGGNTQNLTTSVQWSSSGPGVATINAAGVASSVSPGSTTITATWVAMTPLDPATGMTPGTPIIGWPVRGSISGSTTLTVFTPRFVLTGSLKTGRAGGTATLLNNGMVLIAGGCNACTGTGALASAELYNPGAGNFTPTGNLNTAREGHTATLLNNGKVLIAGGVNSSGYLASAELYDPATGTFSATGSLNTARAGHTATLLNSGMVLIAGGVFSSRAELY